MRDQRYLEHIAQDFTGYGPITPAQFNNLDDYSLSMPTQPSIGRVWKSKYQKGWFLLWTKKDPNNENYFYTCNRKLLSFEMRDS